MSKDPAFLFYPGDYLKDTQCLSEKSQVAYDRIMCEHMRNISKDMSNIYVSYAQHNFFTKRLSEEEKEELNFVLSPHPLGFQIEWVAMSMAERKAYTESRSKNRTSKNKEKPQNTSLSYDPHMEDEDVIVNEDVIKKKKENREIIFPFNSPDFIQAWQNWKEFKKGEFKFNYKTIQSEQAALMELNTLSAGVEDVAIKIIHQSMAKGWKGFFKIDNNNGTGKQTTDYGQLKANSRDRLAAIIRDKHSSGDQ